MEKWKRILNVLLAVLMLVSVVPVIDVGIEAEAVTFDDINKASVFLHQPSDDDKTCVFTSCLNMFRRRAIIDGISGWESITHQIYSSKITTNGVTVRWTITDVLGMNASMTSNLTDNKKSYFISMLNNHPEGIVIYCGNSPMHTVLLTDYDSSTDTFYCAETLSQFAYGRIPLTSCYISTYNGGLSQNSIISKISQIWYISNKSGGNIFVPSKPILSVSDKNTSNKAVTFTWNKTTNTDHYDLRIYNHGDYNTGAPYYKFGMSAGTTSTTMKFPAGKYAAYITAVSSNGTSTASDWITVFDVVDPPGKSVLTATPGKMVTNGVTFNWTKATNAHTYDLRVYNYGDYNVGAPYYEFGISSSTTSTTIKLPVGKYSAYITTKASNGASDGGDSEWISFTVSEPSIDTNYPTNIKGYKMWIGETATQVYDVQTLKSYYLGDNEITVVSIYTNDWAKIKHTVDGTEKIAYIPLGGLISDKVQPYKMYLKSSADIYSRYKCETKQSSQSKDKEVTVIGYYKTDLAQICYTVNNTNYIGWIEIDKLIDHDANSHSYASQITTAATCTAAGVKTFTCSKCSNSYTESIPATGHKWTAATCTAAKTCSTCKATEGSALGHSYTSKVTKAATCTADGVKTFTCSKCSHNYTESIPATGHNWTAATCTAAKTCSVCKATEGSALGHSYTSKVTTAATCTTAGVKTFICSKCSNSYTESIPATGHKWTAATCTAAKTCSVCKATSGSALGHSYTSTVTKAATCTAAGVKTVTCSKCSNSYTESIPATGHTWTAATCTAAKTCSVCKATDGAALGHSYTSKVTKAATCTAAGVKTFTCSKCSNSYTESIPATGHTWTAATCTAAKTCSVCKTTDGAALGHSYTSKVTKAATCTAAGVKTFTCSKCSHSYTESIPATGHTWTAATCTAAKTCSVCKVTDGAALGHNYTSTVTKAATCTAAGVKTFTCSKCNHSYTESIAATGHTWTAATCTVAKTCSVCKATDGAALGHNYTSAVTKSATCTTDGVKTFTCSKCSNSYTETIPATGHTWTAATCTAAKTCSVCKATDGTALGHSYTSKVTKAATCTTDGVKTFTCLKCSHSYTESLPATGHTPGTDATCTEDQTCTVCGVILSSKLGHTVGMTVMENKVDATCTVDGSYNMAVYCATCGEKLSTTPYTITAPGHTPGVAATCTEDQTCTVCGEVLAAKLGHDYDSVVTAPTCTQNGYTIHTCSVCGDSYVDNEVAALGHNWDEGVVTLEPTATQNGIRTYTCAVCGETKTEEIEKLPAVGFEDNAEQAVVDKNGDIVAVLNLTAAQLLEQAGESAVLVNNKGESLTDADKVGTGAVLTLADGTQYKIVVLGDVDGDGAISAGDARAALRHSVGLDTLDGAYLQAADVEEKGVTAGSARSILRASVGLDNPDEWFNKVVG